MSDLPVLDRPTLSAKLLNQWIRDAEALTGAGERRIGWLLASTVVVAALQRALGADNAPLFLVKGGVYMELQLGLQARATKDIDTLFRGTVAEFNQALGEVLAEPWGPFTLQATEAEEITNAKRLIKPCRFDVRLIVRGAIWRKVQVEVSFPEGHIAERTQPVAAPSISFFGVAAPEQLVGIVMDYQVAQKGHACSDPDDPPAFENDRVRDVIDLCLLKKHFYDGSELGGLRAACLDVFDARATEAAQLGLEPRAWPPTITANDTWRSQYPKFAAEVGLGLTLEEAIAEISQWIVDIDQAN
ncbi:MAG: nucleotidyl transferase AbiEii/AbiGii toxin family protein [Propionibacteriaceae bacterium]|jgi:hypothetical protein|nr:nucleotidyl transferase AbiEii/AbiGii toxin family protein [Propionibacteriaceae bacterium]